MNEKYKTDTDQYNTIPLNLWFLNQKHKKRNLVTIVCALGLGIVVIGSSVFMISRNRTNKRLIYKKTINFCIYSYMDIHRKIHKITLPFNRLYYKLINPQKIVSILINGSLVPSKKICYVKSMDLGESDIIEVRWSTWGKKYRTIFNKDNIIFPLYTKKELSVLTKDKLKFEVQTVLLATLYSYNENDKSYNSSDITNIIREYSGPFQDKYIGDVVLPLENITQTNNSKNYLDKNNKNLLQNSKDYIEIMDNMGETQTFNLDMDETQTFDLDIEDTIDV